MGQKKLIRFEAIKTFSNVLQYPVEMPGKWSEHFKNDNRITIELACGKGEYTVGLAQRYPNRNFIGIDLKGNRLYIGAKKCLEQGLVNAAFLRIQIDGITGFFAQQEVAEIWLTFPDPQLRTSKTKKRLTHPKFLRLYQQIMMPGGIIHLKTDSPNLYHFTKQVIALYNLQLLYDFDDVYVQADASLADLFIKTHYERLDIAQSKRIHYLQFKLPQIILPNLDEELYQQVKQYEEQLERRG